MDEQDIREVLGGMVMALSSTMPPTLGQRYAEALRTCAQARGAAGRTNAEKLLQALADAADQAAALPR
jgi:hypothetical protein